METIWNSADSNTIKTLEDAFKCCGYEQLRDNCTYTITCKQFAHDTLSKYFNWSGAVLIVLSVIIILSIILSLRCAYTDRNDDSQSQYDQLLTPNNRF